MALIWSFWSACRPEQAACCSVRGDNTDMLTAEFRESLEDNHGAVPALSETSPGVVSESSAPRSAASEGSRPHGRLPPLVAADEFKCWQLETGSAERQKSLLQASLHAFTRSFFSGVCLRVLLDDGRTLFTEASLDSDLTHIVLHMTNSQRPVALRSIERLCSPEDVVRGGVQTSNAGFVDGTCCTLLLQDGQFLTFVFDTVATREYFETCLQVLLLAKEGYGNRGVVEPEGLPMTPREGPL